MKYFYLQLCHNNATISPPLHRRKSITYRDSFLYIMPRKRCPLQLASGVWIIADIPQVISDGIFWHDSKAICQRLKCSINKPRDLYVKRTVLLSSGECLIKSRWQSLIWLSNTEGYYRITFFFPSFSFFI